MCTGVKGPKKDRKQHFRKAQAESTYQAQDSQFY